MDVKEGTRLEEKKKNRKVRKLFHHKSVAKMRRRQLQGYMIGL